jgi:hypothetical protein
MNKRHLLFLLLCWLLLIFPSQLRAQALALPTVPSTLPATQRQAFETKRQELLSRWDSFLQKKAAFASEFQGVKVDDPRAGEAATRKAALKAEADAIVDEADIFTDRLSLTASIQALDVQIAETQKQLRGLGFTRAVPDFSWFAGQSELARQHMISQLVSHVRDYTLAKSTEAMEEHFLAYLPTLKQNEVIKLADSLKRAGASDPIFQEWLRSFSPTASREVLAQGAKLAIETVKANERLFKIAEEMDKGTVQSQQEAALTVITMLGTDYPGLKELKLVASGGYDVIEAWATIYILDRGIDQLVASTEVQLANQKKIVLGMKDIVDKRNAARADLAKLPAL